MCLEIKKAKAQIGMIPLIFSVIRQNRSGQDRSKKNYSSLLRNMGKTGKLLLRCLVIGLADRLEKDLQTNLMLKLNVSPGLRKKIN